MHTSIIKLPKKYETKIVGVWSFDGLEHKAHANHRTSPRGRKFAVAKSRIDFTAAATLSSNCASSSGLACCLPCKELYKKHLHGYLHRDSRTTEKIRSRHREQNLRFAFFLSIRHTFLILTKHTWILHTDKAKNTHINPRLGDGYPV